MKYIIFLLIISLTACTATAIKKSVKKSEVFEKGFTGFALYDPDKEKMIYSQFADRYFIPASNTKLFTFYVANKILGDSVNGLNYIIQGDSLIFWGTGDPSFLHPDIESTKAYDFLADSEKQLFYANNFDQVTPLGPGWSWDWYNYYFATERSAFPVYGNFIRFKKALDDSIFTFSPYFFYENVKEDPSLIADDYRFIRKKYSNSYSYLINQYDSLEFEIDKPFISSDSLTIELLEDTLNQQVQLVNYDLFKHQPHQQLLTIRADSLYKRLLQNSDNFIAEQVLLLCSDKLFDSLNTNAVIDYAETHFLADLPDELEWADGSGLSKYNMFTPRSIIALLEKIHKEYPEEKVLDLLPAGGESGTIENWYKAEEPYVFAKTGTLSNSICLSGYLLTQSGKKLFFSFMHNNYAIPSSQLKKEMEEILYQIHKTY